MAKAIMIQGTMSNAGKSLIAAGLCRIFKEDGYKVAPFKSQNMALNSYITEEGLEMGRAQVVQAEAAGVKPAAAMNPILLKPSSDTGSQVIVNGIPIGNMSARDYFAMKKSLIPDIMKAYQWLDEHFDIIVIEGAGSPAEINLKSDDIVNMGLAKLVDCPVLLCGDIDRGGVFAQLYGTVKLLEEDEQERIKGLIINKFRGDVTLLDSGIEQIEELTDKKVVGVIPYMNVDIEDEDSLSSRLSVTDSGAKNKVDISVIRFPKIANFTDLQVLELNQNVHLHYVSKPEELKKTDFIILPGTKNSIDDLKWLRQTGLEAAIKKQLAMGVPLWGICGGYQMMGHKLHDPEGTEGGVPGQTLDGMNLFPQETTFSSVKIRTRDNGRFGEVKGIFAGLSGRKIEGYEIHSGTNALCAKEIWEKPEFSEASEAMLNLHEYQENGIDKTEGFQNGNIYGSYVHGIFDRYGISETIIQKLCEKKGIPYIEDEEGEIDTVQYKEEQFRILADTIRKHIDMESIYEILGI